MTRGVKSHYQIKYDKKLKNSSKKLITSHAFTIVELLVVIVVIGILAAITVVSYTGIREKAVTSAIKSQLTMDSKLLKMYYIDHGVYPSAIDANFCPTAPEIDMHYCIKNMDGSTLTYAGGGQSFTLTITNGTISYSITEDGNIAQNNTSPVLAGASLIRAWGGINNEMANSIIQTTDGGYIVAGSSNSFVDGSDQDAYLARYSSDGSKLWNRTWGGGSDDYANRILQTADGGYIMAGETRSYTVGSSDAFIAKYTSSGDLSWSKTWGGLGYNQANGLVLTSDGGYVISGYTDGFGSGSVDAFIVKYNSEGVLIWDRTWGGVKADFATDIIEIDNDYVIAGYTESFGAGGSDSFVARFESNGTLSWSKTWGGAYNDDARGIALSDDGGFAITGTADVNSDSFDVFIVKYDSTGSVQWSKTWGGTDYDEAASITQIKSGNYAITGASSSYNSGPEDRNVFVATFTRDGTYLKSSSFGGTHGDFANSIIPTADGGYAISGRTRSFGEGGDDAFLAKYKPDGTIDNCTSPICANITDAIILTPSITTYSPTGLSIDPAESMSSPDATTGSPNVNNRIIDDSYTNEGRPLP